MRINFLNYLIHHKKLVFSALTALLLLFSVTALRAEDQRIVTLFVDDQEIILPTTAETVGDLIERAGVEVFENDLVEPTLDTEIGSDSFNINIYRARPVTVIDGDKRFKVVSPYQSPRLIAESAGLDVYDEDEFVLERIDNFLAAGTIGMQMTIDRAVPLSFNLYGESYEVRTQAETVGELIAEKDVQLAADDSVRPAMKRSLEAGMEVFVLRNGTDVVTEEQDIEFDVEEITDSSKEIGYREVRTPGELGRKAVTYEITLENGEEVSRKSINEVVLKEPKKQVEVVGSKAVAPTATNISGSKEDWLAASGIDPSLWGYVDSIVTRESGWNPNAVNPSSGACGLGQQLPCGKWAGAWNDPVAALQAMNGYVNGRYGGWQGAYDFWQVNKWY